VRSQAFATICLTAPSSELAPHHIVKAVVIVNAYAGKDCIDFFALIKTFQVRYGHILPQCQAVRHKVLRDCRNSGEKAVLLEISD
jgi:hypothetical protein